MTLGLGLKSNMIPLYIDSCVQSLFDHRDFATDMILIETSKLQTCLFDQARYPQKRRLWSPNMHCSCLIAGVCTMSPAHSNSTWSVLKTNPS